MGNAYTSGRNFGLPSGRIVRSNEWYMYYSTLGGGDRYVVAFVEPTTLDDGDKKYFLHRVKSGFFDNDSKVSIQLVSPKERCPTRPFEQRSPKDMRAQIRQWLKDGILVRDDIGGSEANCQMRRCNTCASHGRNERFCGNLLAPRSTVVIQCKLCVVEDLFGAPKQTDVLDCCSWCGEFNSQDYQEFDGLHRSWRVADSTTSGNRCHKCALMFALDRACWNCGVHVKKSIHNRSASEYTMMGTPSNPSNGLVVHFCDDCNYVPKNYCELCGNREATTKFNNGLETRRACDDCYSPTTRMVAKCADCGVQNYVMKRVGNIKNSNSFHIVESFYNNARGEAQIYEWYCEPCHSSLKMCRRCDKRMSRKELPKYGGVCQECASHTIEENVNYYREDVLNHVRPVGKANRKLGVELELEWMPNLIPSNAIRTYLVSLRESVREVGIIKRDGSLDAGIEFVTTPMSLDHHNQGKVWQELCDLFSNEFAVAPTCGLHVHVSRKGLTSQQVGKLLKLVYYNPGFWSRVAQRESERYAPIRNIGFEKILTDRYVALNIVGTKTVEFRMFKASLDASNIVARIELCDAAVRFASSKLSSDEDMTIAKFCKYVRQNKARYPLASKLFKANDLIKGESYEVDLHFTRLPRVPRPRRRMRRGLGYAASYEVLRSVSESLGQAAESVSNFSDGLSDFTTRYYESDEPLITETDDGDDDTFYF